MIYFEWEEKNPPPGDKICLTPQFELLLGIKRCVWQEILEEKRSLHLMKESYLPSLIFHRNVPKDILSKYFV
ncbi:hypothetical protein SAMN02745219_01334 [Desulfofundulus thermosubterraneus DSM 16057]|uniref:Uncharacterized protein n=1 Tax=Desulfofundulus thermosubterraneus DSM 16057 TaxID=1121432 RepID=A0A1M6EYR4_9FIRM|nr:hypothetical protein SAMN02745219_01334 [Desulfofundulus thermosubterraneus DSM 16057]